jgi:hypothetical protein
MNSQQQNEYHYFCRSNHLRNGFVILASGLLKLVKGFFFIRNMGFVIFLIEFSVPNPVTPVLFVPVILLVFDVML